MADTQTVFVLSGARSSHNQNGHRREQKPSAYQARVHPV